MGSDDRRIDSETFSAAARGIDCRDLARGEGAIVNADFIQQPLVGAVSGVGMALGRTVRTAEVFSGKNKGLGAGEAGPDIDAIDIKRGLLIVINHGNVRPSDDRIGITQQ